MRVLKRTLNVLLIIISVLLVLVLNGKIEQYKRDKEIQDFIERAVYVREERLRDIKYRLHEVMATTDYELADQRITYRNYNDIGSKGDIFATNRNPVPASVITGWVSKTIWIGHTAIVGDDEGKYTYEIVGTEKYGYKNTVEKYVNSWGVESAPAVIMVRIKNTTTEQRDKMIEYCESKIGYPYNFTMLFNRVNSFYCSDLVNRAVKYADINVNYDMFVTFGGDMIASRNTYITYYRERSNEEGIVYNIYYLVFPEGENND